MKKVVLLIFLLLASQIYGQNKINVGANDTVCNQFKDFLNNICKHESDTSINYNDSISKYRLVFSSRGDFIDPKVELMRLCHVKDIKKENDTVLIFYLKNVAEYTGSFYRNNACEGIITCMTNTCWGEALADSMVNIESKSSIWASCVQVQKIKFSKQIVSSERIKDFNLEEAVIHPSIISYQAGKYLIHDVLLTTQIGNQTDSGHIITFYLERID